MIIDDSNWKTLIADAKRSGWLLSAEPKPADHDTLLYSKPFGSVFQNIPRSEWSERIKEQKARKARVSDHQKFDPHAQSGPTCWANGPAHAMTTARVLMGLPLVYISANSVAVPISGGTRGGYEGEAIKYFTEHGGASVDVWPNGSKDRSLMNSPEVQQSRLHHKVVEAYECEGFDEFATAALLGFPTAVSYNWWRHVISLADLVEIEAGSYGFLGRNNWGKWGDNNDYGYSGYVTMREGKGTPSGGFAIRAVTVSNI